MFIIGGAHGNPAPTNWLTVIGKIQYQAIIECVSWRLRGRRYDNPTFR
jgi:hypothetical protein